MGDFWIKDGVMGISNSFSHSASPLDGVESIILQAGKWIGRIQRGKWKSREI